MTMGNLNREPAASRLWRYAHWAAVAGALVFWCRVPPAAAEADKRTLPDYDNRAEEPTSVGDVALWVPRILLSPLYVVSEYVLRRPLGAMIAGAERSGLPSILYDFFVFGPDHEAGIVPIGFIDFGFEPSVGIYAFWDNALVRGHDLRLHATTWGPRWLAAAFADRVHISSDPYDSIALEASGIRRPDYAFYGLGPTTREGDRLRYGADQLGLRLRIDKHLWRTSAFHAHVGLQSVDFRRGGYHGEALLADEIASGAVPAPPGYSSGYTLVEQSLTAALDTRPRAAVSGGSGLHVEAHASHASDLRQTANWLRYGAAASGFLDLNGGGRVVSLSFTALFADPIRHASIPFTELVQLGGFEPMRAFLPGRLIGRSAAVAELAYRWPIWVWLDGAMHFEVGNVFDAHLRDFDPELLRFSGSIGIESRGSPDNALQVLVGLGSETFRSGGKLDSLRLMLGTTHDF
ncbi:MAG TPA: hypothetical protein VFG30_28575 [Polyangiales bacterium]|nr:hypothetical protein [Polyangiales bacterium]